MALDIEGNKIAVGDIVYYARKHNYSAKGELVKRTVTKITDNDYVYMDKYCATDSENQIVIRTKVRKKKIKKILDS